MSDIEIYRASRSEIETDYCAILVKQVWLPSPMDGLLEPTENIKAHFLTPLAPVEHERRWENCPVTAGHRSPRHWLYEGGEDLTTYRSGPVPNQHGYGGWRRCPVRTRPSHSVNRALRRVGSAAVSAVLPRSGRYQPCTHWHIPPLPLNNSSFWLQPYRDGITFAHRGNRPHRFQSVR